MLIHPNSKRLFAVYDAFRAGMSIERIYELTRIDPWFLYHIRQIMEQEADLLDGLSAEEGPESWDEDNWRMAKEMGFSDRKLGALFDLEEETVRSMRKSRGSSLSIPMISGDFFTLMISVWIPIECALCAVPLNPACVNRKTADRKRKSE